MRRKKKRKPVEDPEELELFTTLCSLLEAKGLEIRVEKGDFRGGFCVVEGEKQIVFINKKFPLPKRIEFLLNEIQKGELPTVDFPVDLQDRLDAYRSD
ncbi:MAG: hypothetical protein D6748_13495 [Calditrichaeota bacterium]|nr:MAG: hypothetical protein D6748_13495 [Calditrichota bacterium]